MADTTFEEAKRCPKCDAPGEPISTHPGPKASEFHVYECPTEICVWFGTRWVVQIMADGQIPQYNRARVDKNFKPLTPTQETKARDQLRAAAVSDPSLKKYIEDLT